MGNIWTACGDLSTWNLVPVHHLLPLLHEAVVILVSMFCSVYVAHLLYFSPSYRKSCFECFAHVYFDQIVHKIEIKRSVIFQFRLETSGARS